jgi:hypothetical protein
MKLDKFISSISSHTKTNRYKLTINSSENRGVSSGTVNPNDSTVMYIKSFDLPGISISTTEIIDGTGPIRKIPYTTTFEDITFTVILTNTINPFHLRDKIFKMIDDISPSKNVHAGGGKFRPMRYYDEVAINTLKIDTLSEDEEKVFSSSVFHNAYPIAIGAISYAYSNDEPSTMDITYAYEYWTPLEPSDVPFAGL